MLQRQRCRPFLPPDWVVWEGIKGRNLQPSSPDVYPLSLAKGCIRAVNVLAFMLRYTQFFRPALRGTSIINKSLSNFL